MYSKPKPSQIITRVAIAAKKAKKKYSFAADRLSPIMAMMMTVTRFPAAVQFRTPHNRKFSALS